MRQEWNFIKIQPRQLPFLNLKWPARLLTWIFLHLCAAGFAKELSKWNQVQLIMCASQSTANFLN